MKKCKTGNGNTDDTNNIMGHNKNIIMGLEDELTTEKADPKNVYGASTQAGARLAL